MYTQITNSTANIIDNIQNMFLINVRPNSMNGSEIQPVILVVPSYCIIIMVMQEHSWTEY